MNRSFYIFFITAFCFIFSIKSFANPLGWVMEQTDFNSTIEGSSVRDTYRYFKEGTDKKIEIQIVEKNKQNDSDWLKVLSERYNCKLLNESKISNDERGELRIKCSSEAVTNQLVIKTGAEYVLLIVGLNSTYEEIDSLLRDLKNDQSQED